MAIKDDMEDVQEAVINELITENGITNTLADDQVTESKILNNAVTTNKIANGAVTAAKLGNDVSLTIADGDITTAKLDGGAVTTAKINAEAVTTAKIDDDAVTTAKIDDDAVTPAKLDRAYLESTGGSVSGNLLVGTTNANPTGADVVGASIDASGEGNFSVDGAEALRLNRKSSDGDIAQFRKDGATVGSISSRGGLATNLILRTATGQGAGIGGANSGVLPCDEDGLQDNEINLGASGTRWKDLYLSGTIILSGIPTSEPSTTGAIWNDNGTLKIKQ